jgi:deoxyribodipyrimidine photo-lyase
MSFVTGYDAIIQQLEGIDPVAYGRTRNFTDGAVTRLSPYISRGVISTRMVMEHILNQGHPLYKVEKLLQELAWRDYWQQIWIEKGDQINQDLKRPQPDTHHQEMPSALVQANTGIQAIDTAIDQFYADGYLHNHVRMYIASIACNVGKSHWKTPARWMYYHLIDGDWASNALSWQWVAGSNASKKYYANQPNINKYCHTQQCGTFLDVAYQEFDEMEVPHELKEVTTPVLTTILPKNEPLKIEPSQPILVYNYYNLDPSWRKEQHANRVLLLEPSIFEKYPISEKVLHFILELARNIEGLQLYVGEFEQLKKETGMQEIIFKEHPLNDNYQGTEDARDWMFTVTGYYRSFFSFWKACKKELQ